jgi:hypothetical protein
VAGGEVLLIFVLFFVLAGGVPPDVNEAHYLGKAKHYWNPQWCAGDLLLESADAHLTFYWTFGWLTRFMSLDAVAWVGRLTTWLLLAWAWRRLSVAVVPGGLWSLLTAALFAALLRFGHMAGEWVIGGVEAKGFAYVLVLLGLESLVRGRWSRVWILFGAASAFHVLVGGWSVVAGLVAWAFAKPDRPKLREMLPALLVGGALALPGIVPAAALSVGADAAVAREATDIYVHQRLAHHLVFHRILAQTITLEFTHAGFQTVTLPFTHVFFVRHVALFLSGVGMLRFVRPSQEAGRLYWFIAGAAMIAAVGILIDQGAIFFDMNASQLMRYYWFRLSDVMVPLGVALLLAEVVKKLQSVRPVVSSCALAAMIAVATSNVSDVFGRRLVDSRPEAVVQSHSRGPSIEEQARRYQDWRQACGWIRHNAPPAAIVLTPRHQQTFKWYAARAEVVSWKDIPQDALGIVEWKQRIDDVFPREVLTHGLAAHGEDKLRALAARYGFRYVVVDQSRSLGRLPLPRVFPEDAESRSSFEVYVLPTHEPPVESINSE